MHFGILQTHPKVGALEDNAQQIMTMAQTLWASDNTIKAFIAPEMALSGYPAMDLWNRPAFIAAHQTALENLAKQLQTAKLPALILGGINAENEHQIYNAAFMLSDGKVKCLGHKHHLPNHGIFDEARFFKTGPLEPIHVEIDGRQFGILICEDFWHNTSLDLYHLNKGDQGIIVINASPFETDKFDERVECAKNLSTHTQLPVIYVNMTSGHDHIIFDGGSFWAEGLDVKQSIDFFKAEQAIFSLHSAEKTPKTNMTMNHDHYDLVARAIQLGIRDYVQKNNAQKIVLGLSGGIDSALVATLATRALGSEHVTAIAMPTKFTSKESLEDAQALAVNLGIEYLEIPLGKSHTALDETLSAMPASSQRDLAFENVQSRLRGLFLMGYANQNPGTLVLACGNKSEYATGYATLYGDMCGAYAPIIDLYKTEVFGLSKYLNAQHSAPLIPENIISKPPSAELKPDQQDTDSLPDYDILDAVLLSLIEGGQSTDEIAEQGFDAATVKRVATLLRRAEYKRFQAAPGPKLTRMAFGSDWRYALSNGFEY